MKKYLLNLLLILLLPTVALGANWFAGSGDTDFNAVSGGTTSSVWNSNADGTSGTYLDWSTGPANGDVFVANGATIAIDANIGSGSVTVTLTTEGSDYGGTDGGGFTINISAVDALTLYTNIVAGTTDCLAISGSGAGVGTTELTINGDITGGSALGIDGIYGTYTAGKLVIVGDLAAGSSTGHGISINSSNAGIDITGNSTGSATSQGKGLAYSITLGVGSITGDCIAGAGNSYAIGCDCQAGTSTGYLTVVGNIVNSAKASGSNGAIRWTPTAPANGVTGHYIKFDGGGTAVFAGKNTDDATKALSTFYYIDPTDGTSDVGTASASGGGASAW